MDRHPIAQQRCSKKKNARSNRWISVINGLDLATDEPNRTMGTVQWRRSRVIARERAQKLTQRKGSFLSSSGFSGSISNGKWYRELGSDSTKWRTRSSGKGRGNCFIGWLTHECVINPKHMRTIGSNQSRSTAKIHHASLPIKDRGLAEARAFAMGRWVQTQCGYLHEPKKFEVRNVWEPLDLTKVDQRRRFNMQVRRSRSGFGRATSLCEVPMGADPKWLCVRA